MKYGMIMRSYAPFSSFGLGFHGDGRGPTTDSNVTSRVKAWIVFDISAGSVSQPDARSNESRHFLFPSDTAVPKVRVDSVQLGKNWLHFRLISAAGNPITGRLSPTIDTRVVVTAAISKGHLNINADLTGDQFPNSEVIVQDEGGARRMVLSYETDGGRQTGPFVRLWGDRQAAMSAICVSFPVNEEGRFV